MPDIRMGRSKYESPSYVQPEDIERAGIQLNPHEEAKVRESLVNDLVKSGDLSTKMKVIKVSGDSRPIELSATSKEEADKQVVFNMAIQLLNGKNPPKNLHEAVKQVKAVL